MADYNSFKNVLQCLQSETDVRKEAEETYDQMPVQARMSMLFQAVNDNSLSVESRKFSAILCRRLLVSDFAKAFESLDNESKPAIQQQILLSIVNETNKDIQLKIAEIAAVILEGLEDADGSNNWPQMVPFLFECANSPQPNLREVACHIFAAVPTVFSAQQAEKMNHIAQLLGNAITDQTSSDVRDAGMRALSSFMAQHSTENAVLSVLKDLVPHAMTATVQGLLETPDNENNLKCMIDLADAAPKFLRPYLVPLFDMFYKIVCNRELEDSQRHLALEAIVLMAENMPAAVRKSGHIIGPLVSTLLEMMTTLEEDPDWETEEVIEDDEESSTAVVAESSLDSFACAIGGQHVLNEIIKTVPSMLQNADWKYRHAGLRAISACGEGCHKQMETMLGSILEAVVPRLGDPHPRVRDAACCAIAQMATDFEPKLQKSHHAEILPPLMHVLDDQCARAQANAGAAITNFVENMPKAILNHYLNALLSKLRDVMNVKYTEMVEKKKKLVLTQIVTTVAATADAAEDGFVPYYSQFMPGLLCIMEHATHPDLRMLRGMVIECISMIALAVGKEIFRPDAEPVMKLLLKTQTLIEEEKKTEGEENEGEMAADDPQISYMIRAWTRICKLLGKDFEPYLPMVMPRVLGLASITPDICIVNSENAEDVKGETDWEVVKLNQDEHLALNTSNLEDKATGCQMLVCYAREMKESFAPYVEEVLNLMLPLLQFYFNDEVRSAAAEIMPHLLESLRSDPQAIRAAWERISTALLQAIVKESEREILPDHLNSLACCIETLGVNCLNKEQLTSIHDQLQTLFKQHFEKYDERVTRRQDEDFDEEEEERLMSEKDDDDQVVWKLCDVVHALFVTHRDEAMVVFKELLPNFQRLLEPHRPYTDMQWGLCFWDDLIEFGGVDAWQMRELFLPKLATGLVHSEPGVRQAAIYGVGLMAHYGAAEWSEVIGQFVPPILACIEMEESRSPDNNICTENAISTMTKIMKFRPDCLPASLGDMNQLLARWLQWLPVWEDTTETDFVYGHLCDLVEANNPAVLGPNNANLPRLVQAIAQCFAEDGLSPDGPDDPHVGRSANCTPLTMTGVKGDTPPGPFAYHRCVLLLQQLQVNTTMFEACIGQLTDEQKAAVSKALTSSA